MLLLLPFFNHSFAPEITVSQAEIVFHRSSHFVLVMQVENQRAFLMWRGQQTDHIKVFTYSIVICYLSCKWVWRMLYLH